MQLKAIPAALKRLYARTYTACKRLYERYYAWKHRPPTPSETADAQNYMRQAYSIVEQDYWDKSKYRSPTGDKYRDFSGQLDLLAQAGKSMKQARKLDANASITVERDKQTITYDHDALAAYVLYVEALTHFYIAENYEADATATLHQAFDKASQVTAEALRERAKGAIYLAISAAEKCAIYAPRHVPNLRILAQCYAGTDWSAKRAHATFKKALEADPNDIETLKLAQKYGVR